jgi:hypothetical protein
MKNSNLTPAPSLRTARLLSVACLVLASAGTQAGQHTAPVQVRGYIQPNDNCVVRSPKPASAGVGTPSSNVSITMNCAVGVDYEVRETATAVAQPEIASSTETKVVATPAVVTGEKAAPVDASSLFGRGTGTDQRFWLKMAALGKEFIAVAEAPTTPGVQKNITISW